MFLSPRTSFTPVLGVKPLKSQYSIHQPFRIRSVQKAGARCRGYATHASHYDTLSVSRNSTQKEIKARFYELSRKYHPDISPDSAKKFTEINAAYSVLREERSRRDYDRTLPNERGPIPSSSTSGYRSSGLSRRKTRPMGTPPSSPFRTAPASPSTNRPAGFAFGENPASEGQVNNGHFRFEEHRERHSSFDSRYNIRVQEELSRRNAELKDNFLARFVGIAGLVFIVIMLTGGISRVRAEAHTELENKVYEQDAKEVDWNQAIKTRRAGYEHRIWGTR